MRKIWNAGVLLFEFPQSQLNSWNTTYLLGKPKETCWGTMVAAKKCFRFAKKIWFFVENKRLPRNMV